MANIKEKDWKIFKSIREAALEKFCESCIDEYREILDRKESAHSRHLLMYRIVQNLDKRLELIFSEQTRSKARISLMAMRGEGLADESLVANLSEDLQRETDPINTKWK